MSDLRSPKSVSRRVYGLGVLSVSIGMALALPAAGQMTPEEHASHHPDQAGDTTSANGTGPAPAATAGSAGGMDMGKMMKDMGKDAPKELYPTMTNLSDLSPKRRKEVQVLATERMRSGATLLARGLDRLGEAAEINDYAAMQDATAKMREALAGFDSGVAALRALAEGQPPRQVALKWFKSEMNLQPPQGVESRSGLFGVSPFHLFTMILLVAFAFAMVAMYFFKMRRAAALFGRIESGPGSPPPGSAPPLVGTEYHSADTKGSSG